MCLSAVVESSLVKKLFSELEVVEEILRPSQCRCPAREAFMAMRSSTDLNQLILFILNVQQSLTAITERLVVISPIGLLTRKEPLRGV